MRSDHLHGSLGGGSAMWECLTTAMSDNDDDNDDDETIMDEQEISPDSYRRAQV